MEKYCLPGSHCLMPISTVNPVTSLTENLICWAVYPRRVGASEVRSVSKGEYKGSTTYEPVLNGTGTSSITQDDFSNFFGFNWTIDASNVDETPVAACVRGALGFSHLWNLTQVGDLNLIDSVMSWQTNLTQPLPIVSTIEDRVGYEYGMWDCRDEIYGVSALPNPEKDCFVDLFVAELDDGETIPIESVGTGGPAIHRFMCDPSNEGTIVGCDTPTFDASAEWELAEEGWVNIGIFSDLTRRYHAGIVREINPDEAIDEQDVTIYVDLSGELADSNLWSLRWKDDGAEDIVGDQQYPLDVRSGFGSLGFSAADGDDTSDGVWLGMFPGDGPVAMRASLREAGDEVKGWQVLTSTGLQRIPWSQSKTITITRSCDGSSIDLPDLFVYGFEVESWMIYAGVTGAAVIALGGAWAVLRRGHGDSGWDKRASRSSKASKASTASKNSKSSGGSGTTMSTNTTMSSGATLGSGGSGGGGAFVNPDDPSYTAALGATGGGRKGSVNKARKLSKGGASRSRSKSHGLSKSGSGRGKGRPGRSGSAPLIPAHQQQQGFTTTPARDFSDERASKRSIVTLNSQMAPNL